MTRLAILTAVMLVGSSAVAHAATNCEVNPTTPVYAPDDSAISIVFDSFFAEAGNPANCNLWIDHKADGSNNPDEFKVYRADYQGFVDSGETAHFRVRHDGRTDEADIEGFKDTGDDFYHHYIGKDEDGNITSRMRLTQDEGFGAVIDTLDTRRGARDKKPRHRLPVVGRLIRKHHTHTEILSDCRLPTELATLD